MKKTIKTINLSLLILSASVFSVNAQTAKSHQTDSNKTQAVIVDDNTVYSFVSMETPPIYPGGMQNFYQYIGENLKYPQEAYKNKIEGKVYVSFTIEKDGAVADVKVNRKLGYGCDEEAVRVIKGSKKWKPGVQQGKAVRVRYNMPITFKMNE